MEITEVRVVAKEGKDKKLKGYATVTFDNAFVVRNIKVIQGTTGLFVAMPSKKSKYPCTQCGTKNEIGSHFCNRCGASMEGAVEIVEDVEDREEHHDIAHPINQQFRDYLQSKVLEVFSKETIQGLQTIRDTITNKKK